MAGQTTLKPEPQAAAAQPKPARKLSDGASHLLHDLLVLVELQAKLFSHEAKTGLQKVMRPVLLAAVGGVLLVSTLPVLMLAAAATIYELTPIPMFAAAWIGFGIVFVPAVILLACGIRAVRKPKEYFERSRVELQNNLDWIKSTLKKKASAD